MAITKGKTLTMQAYEAIKDAILSKKMEKSKIYSEQWFADEFNISRTPVREALLQLRSEGLLDVLPNRGVTIKEMTIREAYSLYQVRASVEGYCSFCLASRCGEADAQAAIRVLDELLESCRKNFGRTIELQFHRSIIEFTDNVEFLGIFDRMRTKMDIYWNEVIMTKNREKAVYLEDKKILDCIKAGDSIGAYMANIEHMMATFKVLRSRNILADDGKVRQNFPAFL